MQGSPLPKEAVKNETHIGFHIKLEIPRPRYRREVVSPSATRNFPFSK